MIRWDSKLRQTELWDSPLQRSANYPVRINLFETSLEGHRARYLREIICGLKEQQPDCELRLCIFKRHRESLEYLEFLKPLEDSFRIAPLPERLLSGFLWSDIRRLGLLRDCLRANPCDRLIIPYGDGIVPLMGGLPRWIIRRIVPSATRMQTMLFRPTWVYESQRWTKRLYHQLRRWGVCRWPGWRIHYSDYNAWDRAQRKVDRYRATEISLVPEFFDPWDLKSKSDAIQWLLSHGYLSDLSAKRAASRPLISLPGFPEHRKGAVELIEAFVQDKGLEGGLLLWGPVPRNVQQILKAKGIPWQEDPRILMVEKYVDSAAFEALFSAIDLVVLPYQFHLGGVSSLYLLSVIHRKSTLCDQRAWLGWATQKYQHGKAIDCSDPSNIHRELSSWISGEAIRQATPQAAEQLRSECTQERFRSIWASR
jgi:hypothetical protein